MASSPSGARRRLGAVRRRLTGAGQGAPASAATGAAAPAAASTEPSAVVPPVAEGPLPARVRGEPVVVAQEAKLDHEARLAVRREVALHDRAEGCSILEIGPSHFATFPRRLGYRTRIVDHLDREGLLAKYAGVDHFDADMVEEVDYVLRDGLSLVDVVDERFDLVYAAHVIEHSTSMVDFVEECAALLAPGGVLALVVPDKRYTFDRFRERSSLARVIDAHRARPVVHTEGTLAEFAVQLVNHRGAPSWVRGHRGSYAPYHSPEEQAALIAAASGDEYVDVHNWVVTPHHLRLLLHDLRSLGYLDVAECFFQDTVGGSEFYLHLAADGPGSGRTREELVVLADAELTGQDLPVFGPPGT